MAQTIPSAPTNLVATAPWYNQIILGWSDVSTNEDGFKIERSTDGSVFSQITQVLPNTVAYRDTLTWPGTTYTYRVRAYNKGGNSGYSPVATIASPTPCETTVIAWGEDTFGSTATPTGLTGVVAADDGALDGLILKSDGTVIGWGENDYGEATPPAGLTGVVAVAAGDYHSLALKGDGTVVGWGYNYSGEASPPAGLTNAVAIDAGGAHSLALKADGTVVGWGYNAYGQASPPPGLTGVVAIGAGYEHSLALKSDGTVVGWGHNQYGQASTPPGLSNIVAIAVGDYHNLALQSDGSIVGWGYSYAGETNTPAGLTGVVAIGAGDYFSMALKSDGTVVGWGYPRATVPPAGLTGILSIGVGFGDCVAVTCAPYAPSGLMATTISSNEIDLVWTNNASTQTGFAIERALDNGSGSPGTWAQVTTVGANVTNYDDTGVMPSTIYWYRVRAYDAEGYSPYCNQASAATPPLAAPSGLVLHILSASQISLTWTDDSTAEDGFSIERAPDNGGAPGTWAQVATVTANITNYTDTGLTEVTKYWYRLRAYNAGGYSGYSNQASGTTQLGAPSNLVAAPVATNQINLSWTDNSNIEDGFRVFREPSSNGQFRVIATLTSNVTTYADTGVVCNTTYYYMVRAYKGEQFNSANSNLADADTSGVDSDGDGTPDCWMMQYFKHPIGQTNDNTLATDDPDGDGFTLLQEYLAGVDPTNPSAAFRILSVAPSGSNSLDVSWTTGIGRTNALQVANGNGYPSVFADLFVVTNTQGIVTNYVDVGAATNSPSRFYRVRLVP